MPYNALYDRPAMLELTGDVDGRKVMDARRGPGFYTAGLPERGAEVLRCDASARMIELEGPVSSTRVLRAHSLEGPFTWVENENVYVVPSSGFCS